MMRTGIGWLLGLWVLSASSQPLVVAGCENEEQVKVAEQLIEETRKEKWERFKWEEHCRQAGFEVVGNASVVYLFPIYLTPAFAEQVLVPLIQHVSVQSVPVCRFSDLPPHFQQAVQSLVSRMQWGVHFLQEPSLESLRHKLQKGEILIALSDTFWFRKEEDESNTLLPLASSKRFEVSPSKVLARIPSSTGLPTQPESRQKVASRLKEASQKRWSFLFSYPLTLQRQAEYMKAYLEWLTNLQKQLTTALPNTSARLWEIFYPKKEFLSAGSSYSLDELKSLFGNEVELIVPTQQMKDYSQSRYVFDKWEVGLCLLKPTADGHGVISYFMPLEFLLGLRDY